MINRPNTIQWQRGDIVIHDADAKEHRMLRIVIAVLPGDRARTVFAYRQELPEGWRRKVETFPMRELLDPRRFPEISRTREAA